MKARSHVLTRLALFGVATTALATATATALAPTASGAGASAPAPVSAHAIFDSGAKAPFRVGQVLDLVAAGGRSGPGRITKVCFSPAPIARPACSASPEGAPSAVGTTRITVSFSRRAPYLLKVRVLAAATKIGGNGGGLAVPSTISCPSAALYGTVNGLRTKSEKPLETLPAGTKVALYNVISPGAITMVNYASGRVGIGEPRCATPGI